MVNVLKQWFIWTLLKIAVVETPAAEETATPETDAPAPDNTEA